MITLTGCGYHFTAGAGSLPGDIRTLRIGSWENHSREVGLEKLLTWALEKEFRRRGIRVVDRGGESTLTGVIRRFDTGPVAFSRSFEVLQYQTTMVLDVTLTRDSGDVLWQTQNLSEGKDFSTVRRVVVTTSPEFQMGTLNREDLPGLTDIQLSESQRQQTMNRLLETVAQEVYRRLTQNF